MENMHPNGTFPDDFLEFALPEEFFQLRRRLQGRLAQRADETADLRPIGH